MEDERHDSKKAAVYVGWTTFNNSIQVLATQGIPNRIDRTVFPGYAGSVQSQLLAGLKFLGLIADPDGKPTADLRALAVSDEAAKKKQLEKILRERYADLFKLDLMKTTSGELDDQMAKSYGVTGSTRARAVRFFLAAVAYLGIEISPHLAKAKATNGVAGPKKRRQATKQKPLVEAPPSPGSGTSKQVTLESGGTLTLTGIFDPFTLTPTDRTFVFKLIDDLERYEGEHPQDETNDVETEDEQEGQQ